MKATAEAVPSSGAAPGPAPPVSTDDSGTAARRALARHPLCARLSASAHLKRIAAVVPR